MTDARTGNLLGGFVLLHVVCCGLSMLVRAARSPAPRWSPAAQAWWLSLRPPP
jgi:hypothetical protein